MTTSFIKLSVHRCINYWCHCYNKTSRNVSK